MTPKIQETFSKRLLTLPGPTWMPALQELRRKHHPSQHLLAASAELLGWVMAFVTISATTKFADGIEAIVDLCQVKPRLDHPKDKSRKLSGPTAITLLPQASGNRGMLDQMQATFRATGVPSLA